MEKRTCPPRNRSDGNKEERSEAGRERENIKRFTIYLTLLFILIPFVALTHAANHDAKMSDGYEAIKEDDSRSSETSPPVKLKDIREGTLVRKD